MGIRRPYTTIVQEAESMKKVFVLVLLLMMVLSSGVLAGSEASGAKRVDGQIGIELKVLPYVEVIVPIQELEFEVAGNGQNLKKTVQVGVKSNCSLKVTIVSKGFHLGDDPYDLLNKFVLYKMDGKELTPGTDMEWSVVRDKEGINVSYPVEFWLNYQPGQEWYEVFADTYTDTIAWTVEALD